MRNIILLGSGVVAFVAIALCISMVPAVNASVAASFTPTSTITVEMWQLYDSGAKTATLCSQDAGIKYTWGSTAYCNNSDMCTRTRAVAYPFISENATVAIEGQDCAPEDSPYNCYLSDVVPAETSPALFHPTAVGAQAITARTYAYWHIRIDNVTPGPIDNSSAYQVFVPYRYDTFSQGGRDIVDAALQGRDYLSNVSDYTVNLYGQNVSLTAEDPIFAEFFADIPLQTISNPPHPNLVGVADPISSHPDVPSDGHGHGMSQGGAGRWARGSSSYRCDPYPAPCPPPVPSVPFFAWSVSWPDRFQILTHYYTGVHVRNAGTSNNPVLTPPWRGNVLQVKWSRPGGDSAGICSRIEVWLQNTGITTWYGANGVSSKVGLGYCWNGGACVPAGYLPSNVALGGDLWATLVVPPGSGNGELQIAVYRQEWYGYYWSAPIWFSPDWPRQGIGTFSAGPTYCTRLPLIKRHEPVN